MATEPLPIVPGHSLGFMTLSASLQEVLTKIKEDRDSYPTIDITFSQASPLTTPVVVNLPQNGIRLQFDGSDQRLRLIEVLDFSKGRFAYKGSELMKSHDTASPTFKRIYQLFGASYPGEYIAPKVGHTGTYVLSWQGVAFNFPLQHSAWAPEKDHVSLLGSHAAAPATHMAIFEGASWAEARNQLFVHKPSGPRTSAIVSHPKDVLPAELELAVVQTPGQITFLRRAPAAPVDITIGQTSPQDLLAEFGPPEATHKRDMMAVTDQSPHLRPRSASRGMVANGRTHPTPPSSYSSTGTDSFDTDFDSGDAEDDPSERASRETFWCYFSHGLDILVGPPTEHNQTPSQPGSSLSSNLPFTPVVTSSRLVVRKVTIHGNVPGSYAFNRHRRLRWAIDLPQASSTLYSEHSFDDLQADLQQIFAGCGPDHAAEMGRGKVVNRTWGGTDMADSSFFLPDADQDLVEGVASEQWLGNTKLYTFPGLTFEVLPNGAIAALTIS